MLLEPGFQGFYAVLALAERIAHGVQRDLHGRRGLRQILRGKGKQPDGAVRLRALLHDVSN